jgi:preprotein translocase subunit SecE
MASVTKTKDDKDTADEEPRDLAKPASGKGGDKSLPIPYASAKPGDQGPSYFTLYKRGQGYWTRMGTVGGAIMIGAFTAYNLYAHVPTFLPDRVSHAIALKIAAAAVAIFAIGYSWLAWHLLNKPANVDFLIATDSEMKKVNWTSRAELIGSTKIVIIFMFLIALFLFTVDQIFGWLMFWIHVLKVSPLG